MKRLRVSSRLGFVLFLTACGSSLGTLGVIDDEDADTDAGRDATSPVDATSSADVTADVVIIDATPDVVEAGPTRGSPEGGRPVAIDCGDAGRPPGQPGDAGGCQADLDCDGGANGRCNLRPFSDGGRANLCTYDTCTSDSTCTGVCGCGVGTIGKQNLCLSRSNCRIDGDCAGGERCVFSSPIVLGVDPNGITQGNEVGGVNYTGQALGYFCTTPADTCNDRPDSGQAGACIYNIDKKRWEWGLGP